MLEVTLFFDEGDSYQGEPLANYLLRYLLQQRIRGASLFEARAGFGQSKRIHKPHIFGSTDDKPLMLIFIEDAEKVRDVLPHLQTTLKAGKIFLKRIEAL